MIFLNYVVATYKYILKLHMIGEKMKGNFFKYIFIVFAIGIVIFAVIYIYKQNNNKENYEETTAYTEKTEEIPNIRIAISQMDTIDPLLSKNQNIQYISKLIYEPLFNVTEDYKLENCLVSEYSKSSEDTYLIKLKRNIKWHNGQSLTANDVKFTIDLIKSLGDTSIYYSNVENINEVIVLDDNIIKIFLNQEEEFFEYNLTFPIMSYLYYSEPEKFTDSNNNSIAPGTGMYKISSIEDTQILLKKNKNWWNIENKDSKIDTITIKRYGVAGEVYNEFKLGNIDLIATQNMNIEEYVGTVGYNKIDYKGRNYDYLSLNCQNECLNNKEVRQAINYAIDKSAIVANIYNNTYYTSDFPLDYGTYLYNVEKGSTGYNANKSIELLQNAGWEYKNGYWQKNVNGKNLILKLNLAVNSSNESRVLVAENIKEQLRKVGIIVDVIKVSNSQYNEYLQNKNYDLLLTGIILGINPSLNRYFGNGNIANYYNEDALKILDEIKNITDENILKEKYQTLINLYNNDVPYISLYQSKQLVLYNQKLKGTIQPNVYNLFYNIENWYREY